jgi:hypothetical protein
MSEREIVRSRNKVFSFGKTHVLGKVIGEKKEVGSSGDSPLVRKKA